MSFQQFGLTDKDTLAEIIKKETAFWSVRATWDMGPLGAAQIKPYLVHALWLADLKFDGTKVLDYGCGYCRLYDTLKEFNVDYHGADITENILEKMRQEKKLTKLSRLNEQKVDYVDQTFDVSITYSVFTHMPINQIVISLAELRRVTKDSGAILASTRDERYHGERTVETTPHVKFHEILTSLRLSELGTVMVPDSGTDWQTLHVLVRK